MPDQSCCLTNSTPAKLFRPSQNLTDLRTTAVLERNYLSGMSTTPHPAPRIELLPATTAQAPVLANLLELYSHDFSEFIDLELGEDGRYRYPRLYFTDPSRFPFLIRVDHHLAGFVLVTRGSQLTADPSTWDMAEFFIVRRYRKQGIGREVAHEIWRRFPGPWEIRVIPENQPAHAFWQRAIATFTGVKVPSSRVEQHGEPRDLFRFQAP
jgi:predicted acetyltransferase